MIKKKIKIRASEKLIKEIELDIDTKLSNIRNILENEISFNFILLNGIYRLRFHKYCLQIIKNQSISICRNHPNCHTFFRISYF